MQELTIRRMDPVLHMARFYTLRLQRDLTGRWGLVREWGRVGRPGMVRVDPYDTMADALAAGITIARTKMRRGYAE